LSQVASEIGEHVPAPGEGGAEIQKVVGRSPWQLFWGRLQQDRAATVGAAFIVVLLLIAIFAGVISSTFQHRGPNDRTLARDMTDEFGFPRGPNGDYWFGADKAGRDLFVRVLYGARTSLLVAFLATGLSVIIGVILGLTAGFFGGKIDTVISRGIDVVLSMPLLLFAIGIVAACSTSIEGCLGGVVKQGLSSVIVVIALFSWPYIARIVRGNTLSLREKEFVEASRSLGAGNGRIMFSEVLPNLVAPIIVYATLIIPGNIIFEAYLSFLGMGVGQEVSSWGRMISDAANIFDEAWWMMLFPGLFLLFTTLSFNLLGDGLRDALDPRSNR
jgi:peptide/nickel transport system permease protein